MRDLKIKVHWSFLLLGVLMLIFGRWQIFLWSVLTVILHEMGHSFVGRKLGYKLNVITLLPYGASLSGKNAPFSSNDEIKIAVAGPLVNAFLIIVFVALWWIFPNLYNFTFYFVEANIYTLCFNVLPVYPLDGGRVLNALLSKKLARQKAQKIVRVIGFVITFIFFALFFISFFYKLNYMLGINAILLLVGLFEEDSNNYYEKLTTFEKFKSGIKNVKNIEIFSTEPVFNAYKKIMESGASKLIISDGQSSHILSKNDVINLVLSNPINMPLGIVVKK